MLKESLTLARELPKHFQEIGAILPSSPHLAKLMTKPLEKAPANGTRRILEIGSGTGPITRRIIEHLLPGDHLTVCDINQRLLEDLQIKLLMSKEHKHLIDQVSFVHGDVLLLQQTGQLETYDIIICSLPFTNFHPELVQQFMQCMQSLLSETGTLTFFQYLGLQRFALLFANEFNKTRLREVRRILKQWLMLTKQSGSVKEDVSFLNIPPALVFQLSFVKH